MAGIAVHGTAVAQREDGEEYLEGTLSVELIGDYRRDLEPVRGGITQSVVIGVRNLAFRHAGEVHAGIEVCLQPDAHLVVKERFHLVPHVRRYFP